MTRTSITDVRTIRISVRSQDDALDFYVGKLGFEKRLDAPISPTTRWIEVAPPGASTSIALNVPEGPVQESTDTGVRFSVPDAAAEHATMQERGVDVGEREIVDKPSAHVVGAGEEGAAETDRIDQPHVDRAPGVGGEGTRSICETAFRRRRKPGVCG